MLMASALLPLFAILAWLTMYKFNARQCEQANNDTLEFIKALLNIDFGSNYIYLNFILFEYNV